MAAQRGEEEHAQERRHRRGGRALGQSVEAPGGIDRLHRAREQLRRHQHQRRAERAGRAPPALVHDRMGKTRGVAERRHVERAREGERAGRGQDGIGLTDGRAGRSQRPEQREGEDEQRRFDARAGHRQRMTTSGAAACVNSPPA